MGIKILKCLAAVCLTLGLQTSLAESSAYKEFIPKCSYMSKNPKCWHDTYDPKFPRPIICPSKESCNVIDSVHQDRYGQFQCKDINGDAFNCDKLVEKFGTQLEGVVVKVTTPYVDACHVPGGCGLRGCVPSSFFASASLDQSCQ